ncbi:MAG: glycosyltransferase, partial [Bacteroidota bacterium]
IIFVSVGALSKRKDPLTIIKAFKNYKNAHSYQLLFLGDGVLMKECIDEAAGLNIKFLGNVDNVHEYCQAADVFISASHSEGLPNSVLEAGMCGLYCILSNIPQHTEIFDDKSKQAAFFETENNNEITLLLNSYGNLKSTNTIDFSASKMTKQYEELYFKAKALIN